MIIGENYENIIWDDVDIKTINIFIISIEYDSWEKVSYINSYSNSFSMYWKNRKTLHVEKVISRSILREAFKSVYRFINIMTEKKSVSLDQVLDRIIKLQMTIYYVFFSADRSYERLNPERWRDLFCSVPLNGWEKILKITYQFS